MKTNSSLQEGTTPYYKNYMREENANVKEPAEKHGKATSAIGERLEAKPSAKSRVHDVMLTSQDRAQGRFESGRVSGDKCRLCGEGHTLPSCPTFRLLPVDHRKRIVKAQGKCFMCLRDNHLVRDCRARPCDIENCNGRHSRWLHKNRA